MKIISRSTLRSLNVSLRAIVLFTLITALYTGISTLVGQLAFNDSANGSLIRNNDQQVIGSRIIGQSFTTENGKPLPQYFQSRPSAAGETGYDPRHSGGTNYGPNNPELLNAIKTRQVQIAEFNGVDISSIPADAVTASSSGLDPHISPAYAQLQVNRVARTRGLEAAKVSQLVKEHTEAPQLGYLGAERVNVLELNQALDSLK